LFKEVHAETGEVLDAESAKRLPGHQIFQMYVDLIVDSIPPDFMEHFGFTPIDEPLLEHVFDSESNRIELEEFGRMLWVPTPDILLATKIKSYPGRDKYDKKIKDICDISALLLFKPGAREENLRTLLGTETIAKFKEIVQKEEIMSASKILAVDLSLIESAILRTFPGITFS
jgi:hypothetical protein